MDTALNGSLYYRPSGRYTAAGLVMMVGFGLAAALVLAAVYGYLTQYNPFIYVNFLATVGFGGMLGYAAGIGIRKGDVRSPGLALVLGVLVGAVGLYAGWVFWMHALTLRAGQAAWIWSPPDLWFAVREINESGAWNMRSYTPTGAVLWALWGVEAILVAGITAAVCRSDANEPYCERCGKWCSKLYEDLALAQPDDLEALRSALQAGNTSSLPAQPPAAPDASRLDVSLSLCPECREQGFLTVKQVAVTIGKNDKRDENTTPLVERLQLDTAGIKTALALAPNADGQPRT